MQADDGTRFQVELRNWPEGEPISRLPDLLGDYWPPMGCRLSASVDEGMAEHRFVLDLKSEASLIRFESDLGLRIAEKLAGFVAIHAALIVVERSAIIVPGVSHTGKSTLANAALQAGHRVLSDEYSLINIQTGIVRGWPRPLRRRMPGGAIERIPIPTDSLEHQPTHVLDLRFDSAAKTPLAVEEISPGEVAFSLLRNTVCAQSRPEESLRAVASVAREVRGLRGTRGESAQALDAIVALVAPS